MQNRPATVFDVRTEEIKKEKNCFVLIRMNYFINVIDVITLHMCIMFCKNSTLVRLSKYTTTFKNNFSMNHLFSSFYIYLFISINRRMPIPLQCVYAFKICRFGRAFQHASLSFTFLQCNTHTHTHTYMYHLPHNDIQSPAATTKIALNLNCRNQVLKFKENHIREHKM